MAVTSQWWWNVKSKQSDVNIGTGNARLTRQNWVLQRSRISDVNDDPQLGEHAESIAAYEGGTLVTVSPDLTTMDYITFGTTRNWTDTSYKYLVNYKTSWVGAGHVSKSPYIIGSLYANLPVNGKITVIRPILTYPSTGWQWVWECAEWDANSTAWLTTYTNTSSAQFSVAYGSKYPYIEYLSVFPSAEAATYNFKWSDATGTLMYIYKNGQKILEVPHGGGSSSATYFTVSGAFSAYIIRTGYGADSSNWYEFVVVNRLPVNATPTNIVRTAAVLSADRSPNFPDCPTCSGVSFSSVSGSFSGASTATVHNEGGGVFYCSSDTCSSEIGAPWHTQTQEWIYKEGWA